MNEGTEQATHEAVATPNPAVETTSEAPVVIPANPADETAPNDATVTTRSRKLRALKSEVWKNFNKVTIKGVEKAECLHCGQYLSASSKNGTSHLKDHTEIRCSKKNGKLNVRQQMLNFNRKTDGTAKVENHNFDQEVTRKELALMVVMHEYPLNMVEHIGFKRYTSSLNPSFKLISRPTLRSDIIKMFESEKVNLRQLFEKHDGRIAITTDMWTAGPQKKGYMAVTAHYIDEHWNLKNKTIR